MTARPYRLCFVNSMRGWGGAEVWMLETARALRDRGHAVELVTSPNSELHRRAVAAAVPVKPLAIRIDNAPWTIAALALHLRRAGVTAVIANRTKDVKAAAPAARLAGLEVILATRESDFPLKSRWEYRWNFRTLCTGMLVNSRATRRTVLQSVSWLDPARVHLLYKGIDCERFRPGGIPQGRPVVGFVGQLIPRKGVPELIRAWTMLEARAWHSRPLLRLAGDGILRAELESWRTTLQFPQDVEILGPVARIEDFYRELHVLAMPSHAEGFGLAAAEAQASGVPVVAGDASSLPEIVDDGLTGLLVPPGDSGALHDALVRLIEAPDWARRLGRRGRQRVRQRFPREESLTRLLALTGLDAHATKGITP